MTPVLETRRLILRPVTLADAPSMQRYFNNWDIIKNLGPGVPWPYPMDGSETFLRDIALPAVARGDIQFWGITLRGVDEVIGIIEFRPKANDPNGDRGFWLAEPFWGQGLMSEATAAVNDYIFDVMGLESFIEHNSITNTASHALKLQWNAEFIGDEPAVYRNGSTKTEIWRITRDGWRARKPA